MRYTLIMVFVVLTLASVSFFNKKDRKINVPLALIDKWALAKSELNGKPVLSRYLDGATLATDYRDYPYQIGIAIPLLAPDANGFPSNEEGDQLAGLEDSILQNFSKLESPPIQVMSISHNGMREFVYYSRKWAPEEYEKVVKSINSNPHELQFMVQEDKNWETYRMHSARK